MEKGEIIEKANRNVKGRKIESKEKEESVLLCLTSTHQPV